MNSSINKEIPSCYNFKNFYICNLKKLVAIFLLFQILSNNSFAEELIKMPRLFTHYFHHSQEHKDTKGFFDYLHNHYSDTHENDDNHSKGHSDEDNDCNLPFKHCGGCCLNIHVPATGFVPSCLIAGTAYFQIKNSKFISRNDRIESLDLHTIWQPPKLA